MHFFGENWYQIWLNVFEYTNHYYKAHGRFYIINFMRHLTHVNTCCIHVYYLLSISIDLNALVSSLHTRMHVNTLQFIPAHTYI